MPPHLTALLLTSAVPEAAACLFEVPGTFELDPASNDAVSPGSPGEPATVRIGRGDGPVHYDNCISESTSCDWAGTISVAFVPAQDDRSPEEGELSIQEGVGYFLRHVDGTLPDGLTVPEEPTAAFLREGVASILLLWRDGETAEQEPFEFTLGITPVDLAGNRGPELEVVIADAGREPPADTGDACSRPDAATEAGCGTGSAAMLIGLALTPLTRRGKRRG